MTNKVSKRDLRKMSITLDLKNGFSCDEVIVWIHTEGLHGGCNGSNRSQEEIRNKYVIEDISFRIEKDCEAGEFCKKLMDAIVPVLSENIYPYGLRYILDAELKRIKFFAHWRIKPEFLFELISYFSVRSSELKHVERDFAYPWVLKVTN